MRIIDEKETFWKLIVETWLHLWSTKQRAPANDNAGHGRHERTDPNYVPRDERPTWRPPKRRG